MANNYARLGLDGQLLEYPVSEQELRKRYPYSSFPRPFEPPSDYARVIPTARPERSYTQNALEDEPVYVDGSWRQVWRLGPASTEEQQQRTADKASDVREQRDGLLQSTDWTQLPDADPTTRSNYVQYRRDLRDLTKQAGFPWEVTWPDKP